MRKISVVEMEREEIIRILGGKCISCGSKKRLHIHHKLPHWLWRYVGETDRGVFSRRFLDNYEIVCYKCHQKRHGFINRWLVIGFKWHYTFDFRWRRPNLKNIFTYQILVNDEYWTFGTYEICVRD